MKRIVGGDRLRQAHYARQRWFRKLTRRQRRCLEKPAPVVVQPPRKFNLSTNYHDTVTCLQELKAQALSPGEEMSRQRLSIDLVRIDRLSVAAALVLSAEIDRCRRTQRIPLQPNRVRLWTPQVKSMLMDLGFFELLGVDNPRVPDRSIISNEVTILPLMSYAGLDTDACAALEDQLRDVASAFQQEPSIFEALAEATHNAVDHAYPENYEWRFPPLRRRWWATGSWHTSRQEVKFLVYDQGVGIPATLPRWDYWEAVRGALPEWTGNLSRDHAKLIRAALDISRTSKGPGRGRGLNDVISLLKYIKGGRVRILSGKGQVLYHGEDRIELSERELHLGGTLIEWTIPV